MFIRGFHRTLYSLLFATTTLLLIADLWSVCIATQLLKTAGAHYSLIWHSESIMFVLDFIVIVMSALGTRWAFLLGLFTAVFYAPDVPPLFQYWHWVWADIYISNFLFVLGVASTGLISVVGLIFWIGNSWQSKK